MKTKWCSILTFLIISGIVFIAMYYIQNKTGDLKMEDLEKVVEKEIIEFHSK